MLPLYSAVLSSDGLFADLIDLRGLYGAGRLRLTVDRGSARLSAGAAPDALDVIGDYLVGVSEVSIPLTRWVKVERLTGNSSTILVEILPHTADKRNVIAALSAQGVVKSVLRVTQSEYDALVSGSLIDLETAYVVTEGALYVGLTLISNVGGGGGGATRYDSALPALSNYFVGAAGNATMPGSQNTAGGFEALKVNTTGNYSAAFGYRAMWAHTTGGMHAAFGHSALQSVTTGAASSAFGYQALKSLTTGGWNTAIGFRAGQATTGSYNTIAGADAAYTMTSGQQNVIVGYKAGYSMTTVQQAIAIGFQSQYNCVAANGNIGIGQNSIFSNVSGTGLVAVGLGALQACTASYNTAIGDLAAYNNTTGTNNTAVGRSALFANTTGIDITAVGSSALTASTTGTGNTAVGAYSFGHATTGSYNTGCGRASGWYVTTGSDNTNVGYRSGYGNSTGSDNVTVGFWCGHNTPAGNRNVFVGANTDYWFANASGMTATAVAGSGMAVGSYSYRTTCIVDGVESALSEFANATTSGGNLNVSLAGIPIYSGPRSCSARKIYRTPVGGENVLYLVATLADNTTTTYTDSTPDGSLGAQTASSSGSVIIGYGAKGYKSGQFVVGSSASPISEVCIGGDIDDISPAAVTHSSSNGRGTNVAGGDYRVAGGRGTGSAKGGRVILSASPAGSAGTGANALTDWVTLDGNGFLNIKETSSAAVPAAAAGSINLFVEGGALKFRDSAGTVKTVTAA